jgi:hypothetical protein
MYMLEFGRVQCEVAVGQLGDEHVLSFTSRGKAIIVEQGDQRGLQWRSANASSLHSLTWLM